MALRRVATKLETIFVIYRKKCFSPGIDRAESRLFSNVFSIVSERMAMGI